MALNWSARRENQLALCRENNGCKRARYYSTPIRGYDQTIGLGATATHFHGCNDGFGENHASAWGESLSGSFFATCTPRKWIALFYYQESVSAYRFSIAGEFAGANRDFCENVCTI